MTIAGPKEIVIPFLREVAMRTTFEMTGDAESTEAAPAVS
jgi:hypothetical protein